MSDTADAFTTSTSSLATSTTFVESSGSVTMTSLPFTSETILPVKVLPLAVVTTDALYWSEMTLLGSVMASTMSRRVNRPASWVRSGPVAPPSPPKRWHTTHRAAANVRSPFLKFRPFANLASIPTRPAVVHSWPGPAGLGSSFALYAFRRPVASMASRSASVVLAKASLSIWFRNPW